MPRGVRGTRDFYKERFGLGDRLAVRLATLLARKVELTAAAIECLRDSPAFQQVVLHPELPDLAPELDTAKLLALAAEPGALPASFAVAEEEGWRVVALDEELEADRGPEGEAEAALPVLAGKAEVLHPGEIADLFTRRDIAELELTLRTSASPDEKVTAIRRLALSPASHGEKLALFAMALTDRAPEVRSEAAEGLTTLGLPRQVAEDARALAEGNDRQKRFAAQRIGSRIQGAADAEMGVLLRIIAGTLRYEQAVDVRRLLIRAIEGACRAVAQDPRSTRDLVHVLLGQLRDAADDLGAEVRRVLQLLGQAVPAEVYRLLQDELASLADHAVRRLVVAAAADLAEAKDQQAQVCGQAVEEFLASTDPGVECLPLANALALLGEPAVAAIGRRLLEAPEGPQDAMVRLLDVIATRPGTSKAAKARIGRLLLAALGQGQRSARLAVIQATATSDPALPAATRRALAAELLACLQEYANPGILDAIEATVARLGAPALGPLADLLARGERTRERASAARILGNLVPTLGERHARAVRGALAAALAQLDGDFPDKAALARALGQMAAGPAVDEAALGRVTAALRARVVDRAVSNAALEGLGWLCLSPRAAPALKVDLVQFFTRLLERDLPDIEPRESRSQDEAVYSFGGEVAAYTEMVPGLILGLQNIALTSPGILREQALDALLRTWRRIAEEEVQLGPGNTELLLKAFRALGTLDGLEPQLREAIAEAVALREDFLPTRGVLADLVVAAGPAMARRAAALAEELLRREATQKQLTESERAILLGSLVRLATAASLGRGAARLRERIVGTVVEAGKREIETARGLAEQLLQSPTIPAPLKRRLKARFPPE